MHTAVQHDLRVVPESQRRVIDIPSIYMPDSAGALFEFTPLRSDRNTGRFVSRAWDVGNCLFSEFTSDPFAVRKSKQQAANGEPLVFLHRLVRGFIRGRSGDRSVDRDRDAVYLLDQARQTECVQSASTMQSIHILKSAIGYNPDVHDMLIAFPSWHPLGQTLHTLLDEIFDSLLIDDTYDYETYAQLIACLTVALDANCERSDVRQRARDALQRQICCHIERNLAECDLSAETLLRDFGLSRASLYRMFTDRGGVRQYISDRRLLRAVLEISQQAGTRGAVTQAAGKWGFSSDANFSRSVRRHFGVPPGALVSRPDHADIIQQEPIRPGRVRLGGIRMSPNGYRNKTISSLDRLAKAA